MGSIIDLNVLVVRFYLGLRERLTARAVSLRPSLPMLGQVACVGLAIVSAHREGDLRTARELSCVLAEEIQSPWDLPSGSGFVLLTGTRRALGADDLDKARRAHEAGDYKAELAELKPRAEEGNPTAQRYLAYLYFAGKGVEKDPVKAIELLRRSADRGDLLSVFSLGGAYAQGLGVEKNDQAAVVLYRRAADGGLANAQLNLGSMYRFGRGIPQDLKEAVKWYRAAAEQGHPRAEAILGFCYTEGLGVERDDSEAVRWLRRASDKDYPEAQYFLALNYLNGVGVTKNLDEAVRWFSRAAEWGESRAQYALGVSYATGQGNTRDAVQAHVWFSLAASRGDSEGKAAAQSLEQAMSPEQLVEAQRLSEGWKPRKQTRPEGMPDWEWLARTPNPDAQ